VLKEIFGHKKEEVRRCRELHNEELHDFTPHQFKDDEMGGTCGTTWREEKCTQCLGGEN
jgi:hypothetical protein